VIEIDGAFGEVGGQLLRTAVAIAAIRGVPIRVFNVRARRRNPGLAPQHVAAVRAVAALCDAECTGVEPRSTALTFAPRALRGGDFTVDVGTAGSVTLVLQAMLPALVAARQRCRVALCGGTDVPAAPPADYLRRVLLPLLATMGVRAELTVVRRGYYPRGGGAVHLALEPTAELRPFAIEDGGPLHALRVEAHVSRLPRDIAERMVHAARAALPQRLPIASEIEIVAAENAAGPGGAILLRALFEHTVLAAARVAERGVRAEALGRAAAADLLRDLQAHATLDVHAADQMLVFMALAAGRSAFRAAAVSSHAGTAMALLQRLAATRFEVAPAAAGVTVQVFPAASGEGR
jgi:RNA 3'-phosphate cyclase